MSTPTPTSQQPMSFIMNSMITAKSVTIWNPVHVIFAGVQFALENMIPNFCCVVIIVCTLGPRTTLLLGHQKCSVVQKSAIQGYCYVVIVLYKKISAMQRQYYIVLVLKTSAMQVKIEYVLCCLFSPPLLPILDDNNDNGLNKSKKCHSWKVV